MLDKTCTIFCKDWSASPSGFFSWSGRLEPGLRIAFLIQHLRDIASVDEHIGDEAIVDISSKRDDADGSTAEQFFQSLFGGLATWLVQFRRVDASESDALGPISKCVTINHLDVPTVDRAGACLLRPLTTSVQNQSAVHRRSPRCDYIPLFSATSLAAEVLLFEFSHSL